MSKLIRKLSKVLNTRQKDVKKDSESDDEDDLQVDAIPTSTAVVPRLTEVASHCFLIGFSITTIFVVPGT